MHIVGFLLAAVVLCLLAIIALALAMLLDMFRGG